MASRRNDRTIRPTIVWQSEKKNKQTNKRRAAIRQHRPIGCSFVQGKKNKKQTRFFVLFSSISSEKDKKTAATPRWVTTPAGWGHDPPVQTKARKKNGQKKTRKLLRLRGGSQPQLGGVTTHQSRQRPGSFFLKTKARRVWNLKKKESVRRPVGFQFYWNVMQFVFCFLFCFFLGFCCRTLRQRWLKKERRGRCTERTKQNKNVETREQKKKQIFFCKDVHRGSTSDSVVDLLLKSRRRSSDKWGSMEQKQKQKTNENFPQKKHNNNINNRFQRTSIILQHSRGCRTTTAWHKKMSRNLIFIEMWFLFMLSKRKKKRRRRIHSKGSVESAVDSQTTGRSTDSPLDQRLKW